MASFEIERLELLVDELLQRCRRLQDENQGLRARHDALAAERAGLVEKTEQARSRVEGMLTRLRTMEEQL